MQIRGTFPKHKEEEAHIVRRLGWALIEQWAALPEEFRTRLVHQATFVGDDYQTVQLQQQIEDFIEEYAPRSSAL